MTDKPSRNAAPVAPPTLEEKLAAAIKALEEASQLTAYSDADDEAGYRPCCSAASYEAHKNGCWLVAAITYVKS